MATENSGEKMTLAEDAYYDHDVYGRVQLLTVDQPLGFSVERNGYVGFQPEDQFRTQAEPADVELSTSSTSLTSDTPAPR